MSQPIANLADGFLKVLWVPALTSTTAPTATQLTAVGTVDLSCYLTADGFSPGTDEQSITDDRLCSTQTYEQPGRYSDSLEIMYVFRAQDPSAADNKAYSTLARGVAGFVVVRWGLDYSTAIIAAQRVDVMPATCGIQKKQPPEANSVLKISQKIFITGSVQRNVAVV